MAMIVFNRANEWARMLPYRAEVVDIMAAPGRARDRIAVGLDRDRVGDGHR
jgi:hypothetical protein